MDLPREGMAPGRPKESTPDRKRERESAQLRIPSSLKFKSNQDQAGGTRALVAELYHQQQQQQQQQQSAAIAGSKLGRRPPQGARAQLNPDDVRPR